MPPKNGRPAGAPALAAACCGVCLASLPPHVFAAYVIVAGGRHFCRTCGHEVHQHPAPALPPAGGAPPPPPGAGGAAAPPPAGGAGGPPPGAPPVAPPLAPARAPPVPPPGPLVPPADPATAFREDLADWKAAANWCADDLDAVLTAFATLEASFFDGTTNVLHDYFVIRGEASPTRTFELVPAPPGTPDVPAWLRTRGRNLLACVRPAKAYLRIQRAYARKRVLKDKSEVRYLRSPQLRSSEWRAVSKVEENDLQTSSVRPHPRASAWESPAGQIWHYLYVASLPHDQIREATESLVEQRGDIEAREHQNDYVSPTVWATKHSQEALDRAAAGRQVHVQVRQSVAAAPRGRNDSADTQPARFRRTGTDRTDAGRQPAATGIPPRGQTFHAFRDQAGDHTWRARPADGYTPPDAVGAVARAPAAATGAAVGAGAGQPSRPPRGGRRGTAARSGSGGGGSGGTTTAAAGGGGGTGRTRRDRARR